MFPLSVLIGAAPFAFGVIRAITTRSDVRYLWMAAISWLAVTAAMNIAKSSHRTMMGVLAVSAAALIASTVVTFLVVSWLGQGSGAGLAVVAFSFALCFSMSHTLRILSR